MGSVSKLEGEAEGSFIPAS